MAKLAAGELSRVEVLKVLGMVNGIPEFGDHPKVINGCSDLFVAVLGDRGCHALGRRHELAAKRHLREFEAVMRIHD